MLFNFVEGYAILVSKLKTQAGGVCFPPSLRPLRPLKTIWHDGGKKHNRLLYNIPSKN